MSFVELHISVLCDTCHAEIRHEVFVLCVTAVWEEVAQSTFTLLISDFEYFGGVPAPYDSSFVFVIQATCKTVPEYSPSCIQSCVNCLQVVAHLFPKLRYLVGIFSLFSFSLERPPEM